MRLAALALAAAALAAALPAAAQDLRGHGGPVRALAVDGARILSGGLDTRAIRWAGDAPAQIVRGHTGAVTAVLPLPDGFATGGQDGQVILWRDDSPDPVASRSAHEAPVSALAALPEGIASAGWDGRIRLPDGTAFDAHQGQVTGLVATASGLASIGTDLRLRFWQGTRLIASVDLASPPAALAAQGAGVIVAGAAGGLRRAAPAHCVGRTPTPPIGGDTPHPHGTAAPTTSSGARPPGRTRGGRGTTLSHTCTHSPRHTPRCAAPVAAQRPCAVAYAHVVPLAHGMSAAPWWACPPSPSAPPLCAKSCPLRPPPAQHVSRPAVRYPPATAPTTHTRGGG